VNWLVNIYRYFRYWKARRLSQRLLEAAAEGWRRTANTEPQVVETLEGLRSLAVPGVMDRKLIRVVGEFEVHSPIEIWSQGSVYDFDDCVLIAKKLPVFITRGVANCLNGVFINVDLNPEREVGPFEAIRPGQEPSGNCVIAGYPDTGTAFIELEILCIPRTCPTEETDATGDLLD
jgi:hypothetical protein